MNYPKHNKFPYLKNKSLIASFPAYLPNDSTSHYSTVHLNLLQPP